MRADWVWNLHHEPPGNRERPISVESLGSVGVADRSEEAQAMVQVDREAREVGLHRILRPKSIKLPVVIYPFSSSTSLRGAMTRMKLFIPS